MPDSYHQYTDYSSPATPHVCVWEASSVTTGQDPTHNLHHPQQQQQEAQKPHAQVQDTTLAQLHFQEMSSSLPQNPQTSISQAHHLRQQLQHKQHISHHAIDPQPSVDTGTPQQPQYQFETMTEEDFTHLGATRQRAVPAGSLRVFGRRPAASGQLPHVSTSPRPAPTPRVSASQSEAGKHARPPSAHPYRQSQYSPAFRAQAPVVTSGISGNPQWVQQHASASVKAPSATALQSPKASWGDVSPNYIGAALFTVGTPTGVSCPASSTWRGEFSNAKQEILKKGASSQANAGNRDMGVAVHHTPVQPAPLEFFESRRYRIRTDIHFNMEENVITAMFELPGVKRDDLQITMAVCPFSRVRQLRVSGVSVGVLPLQGHQVRERKFGKFFRTLVVPPETKLEDISAKLEDGVLTLKIPGGAPVQAQAQQDIIVPLSWNSKVVEVPK